MLYWRTMYQKQNLGGEIDLVPKSSNLYIFRLRMSFTLIKLQMSFSLIYVVYSYFS